MWTDIKRIDSSESSVCKFVYTKDNAVAESVLYKYPDYATRTVICCSTQSGCPVGCRFCGAGDAFVRSLTTEEIIDQVDYSIAQTNTGVDGDQGIGQNGEMGFNHGIAPRSTQEGIQVDAAAGVLIFPNAIYFASTDARPDLHQGIRFYIDVHGANGVAPHEIDQRIAVSSGAVSVAAKNHHGIALTDTQGIESKRPRQYL